MLLILKDISLLESTFMIPSLLFVCHTLEGFEWHHETENDIGMIYIGNNISLLVLNAYKVI